MRGTLLVVVSLLLGARVSASAAEKKPFRDDFKTARDGVTKGWLIEYPWPDQDDVSQSWRTIPGKLVLSRHGQVIRRIEGGSTFWSWNFWANGRQVVYETGPVHGETMCVRVDVRSGRMLERWPGDCRDIPENVPAWVKAAVGNP